MKIDKIVALMRHNAKGVRFDDLCKVCDHYFGQPRQKGSSHRIYKTPFKDDSRLNIQDDKGQAKSYQVKQVLKIIDRLEAKDGN